MTANRPEFSVLVVVAILDWTLMLRLAWSIGTMTVTATIAVIFLWLQSKHDSSAGKNDASEEISLKNPFSLGPAIKFSLFFVGILFVAKIAKLYLGDKGLYLASLVSGLADVDFLAVGDDHVCAITSGDVYCWGSNTTNKAGVYEHGAINGTPPPRVNAIRDAGRARAPASAAPAGSAAR